MVISNHHTKGQRVGWKDYEVGKDRPPWIRWGSAVFLANIVIEKIKFPAAAASVKLDVTK